MASRFKTPFTDTTLSFLRALKRNNDREWFKARSGRFEHDVRGPMAALVEQLALDFRTFAPELVASPRVSIFRMYRDTRFSEDKSPLKTHIAAVFPWRGMPKGEGVGLYVEVTPGWVWMGGGCHTPAAPHLLRIREHVSSTFPAIERIVRAPAFKRAVGTLDGRRLTRVPRGFAKEDPAADYLKFRDFIAGCEYPPEFATSARFYPALVRTFKAVMPLVRFLNAASVGHRT